ncbi:MAG: FtsW/RodA/SpoVE family cell cycle protein [Oscillospiraceae bacterium]|nr:FtsW/RodA/SpoVE family cell cycle protein [Oscillospiraceae bacterium]MBO5918602.1 FtsW/RodA/SpoVE family cell cycle protein [Oscillospiraceae bacterium]
MDLPYLMLLLLLLGMGVLMVMSASYAGGGETPLAMALDQAKYALGGLVIMYAISRYDYQKLRFWSVVLLAVSFVLLVLVLTPLGVARNGAQRWLRMLLFAGPTYQPSEIAKVAIILFFATSLSVRESRKPRRFDRHTPLGSLGNWAERVGLLELGYYVGILGIFAALMLFEPHMSGTVLLFVGAAAVMFVSGISLKLLFALGGIAGVGILGIILLQPYMRARLMGVFDTDISQMGYQSKQSLLGIGSGGLLGLGLGNSRQKYQFLPEAENDFIFSIVVEELGFVGGILILALFMMFVLRGYWIALHARDRFGAMTAVGITTLFAVQVFLNVGVVTSLLPNTGISLPFFSYGGTALIMQLAQAGIMLSISRQIPTPKQD